MLILVLLSFIILLCLRSLVTPSPDFLMILERIEKRVSKAEKMRLHCCGTDKMKHLDILPFASLTSPFCYLCPDALKLLQLIHIAIY